MKKFHWTLALLLPILVLLTTGCAFGGGESQPEEVLKPITAADWPTPQPTSPPASPTPFPKVTLAPTARPSEPAAAAVTATPPAGATGLGINLDELPAQVISAASSKLNPVATGLLTADQGIVRQGPGTSYGQASVMAKGDLVAIFGTDTSRQWFYVLNTSLQYGWLPTDSLRVIGSMADAPVLPPNPLAALAAASPAAASAPAANPAVNLDNLQPVTTARVKSPALNMRQGPGAAYSQLAVLSNQDQVKVLALNKTRDWVLVETAAGQRGWLSLPYLAVDGSLDQAPVVVSSPPGQALPAGQVAPVTAGSAGPAAPAAGQSQQPQTSSGSLAEVARASFGPAPIPANPPAIADLKPVAEALIGQPEVGLRPGPGEQYAPFKMLTQDDEKIAILGLDNSKNWVLVNPAYSGPGWVALSSLKITAGSASEAPVVTTAWVESNDVEVRRGPGIYEAQVGQLAINSLVQVLGLNEAGRSWALVRPINGDGPGWAPVEFLNVAGRLADLPVAPALPAPDQGAQVQAASPPALPARPLNETRLTIQLASGGDIMLINGDGTGLRRLTSGIDPVLSPDGQQVAFTRWEGETGSLWTIGTDGSNEKSVAGFIKQAKGPAWSPDGSRIVLNYQNGGRLEEKANCYDLSEGAPPMPPRNATDPRVEIQPRGSAGGRPKIDADFCYTLPPDPHWGLQVVNLADGASQDVDGGTYAFRPTWDPTQPWRIVSDGGRGLVQVDLNSPGQNRLVTDVVNDGSPVFSPDGRYLAVVSGTPGGGSGYNIYRMNADGSGRVQLTNTPVWVTVQPDKQKAWNFVSPAWSPDGSQIAFLTDRTGRWEVWVMNADGSNQHPMFSDEVNDQLSITYNFVDERVLSWR